MTENERMYFIFYVGIEREIVFNVRKFNVTKLFNLNLSNFEDGVDDSRGF